MGQLSNMDETFDCVVVGAGPAGLTAAIYLARFNLTVKVIDGGASRCATIPRTRNHAGFPGGISGKDLLQRMRDQAAEFGVRVVDDEVQAIHRDADCAFLVRSHRAALKARAVVLATGVVNNRPPITENDHRIALEKGLLRYCPICDGYEVKDEVVGVIAKETRGGNEATFLRMYTKKVPLMAPETEHALTGDERQRLAELDVRLVSGPCGELRLHGDQIVAPTPSGDLSFDAIYPALGSVIRSELAIKLGAEASEEGCLVVDDHQRTSIGGLYAAGDVAKGLDQISHAMGEAGVAATTIRNDLAKVRALAR